MYEKGTAAHRRMCIPGRACVERLVDLRAALSRAATIIGGALLNSGDDSCRGFAALTPDTLYRMPEWVWRVATIADLWLRAATPGFHCLFSPWVSGRNDRKMRCVPRGAVREFCMAVHFRI